MHHGVFKGQKAKEQPVRILILGESHYWSENKKEEDKLTSKVVETYLKQYNWPVRSERDRAYRFFDYIVRTFSVDPELNREDFWNKVYFGNYIDEPCGIRDSTAANLLKKTGKCEELNRQLFKFIEENEIDIVFCFSRRVYSALPQLEKQDSENELDGADAHRLEKCIYNPGVRENFDIDLDKPVTFYGLRHTSQGFSYRQYQDRIKKVVQEHCLPF